MPLLGMRLHEPVAAVAVALLVAVLAVRALGQTDLNPVSGVGKLSQACTLYFPAFTRVLLDVSHLKCCLGQPAGPPVGEASQHWRLCVNSARILL